MHRAKVRLRAGLGLATFLAPCTAKGSMISSLQWWVHSREDIINMLPKEYAATRGVPTPASLHAVISSPFVMPFRMLPCTDLI